MHLFILCRFAFTEPVILTGVSDQSVCKPDKQGREGKREDEQARKGGGEGGREERRGEGKGEGERE